jgi:hypothetical protein
VLDTCAAEPPSYVSEGSATLRHRPQLVAFLLAACLGASCSFLQAGDQASPFLIPTTTVTQTGDETLFAWMQKDEACLFLAPRDDTQQRLLPIWADGFSATIGPRFDFLLYPAPLTEFGPIGISELMELRGEYIESAPADAVVLPECAKYPLFLVREAVSRS